MSQNCGFLKMCSRKVCALESVWRGARDGEQIVMGRLPGMAVGSGGGGGERDIAGEAETDIPMVLRWPVLLLTSESSSVWNFTSSIGRWKKLSALLLRKLLVLKDSERFSLCSWNKHKTEKKKKKKKHLLAFDLDKCPTPYGVNSPQNIKLCEWVISGVKWGHSPWNNLQMITWSLQTSCVNPTSTRLKLQIIYVHVTLWA